MPADRFRANYNYGGEVSSYLDWSRAPRPWGYQGQFGREDSIALFDELTARKLIHGYYASLSYADAQLGKVLDELDRVGLRENTIIILWSDHGWMLGELGEWRKHGLFDLQARAPLMLSPPGYEGAYTDAITELLDIYPTLCELAGLPIPGHVQGKSFAHLLGAPQAAHKDAAYTQYPNMNKKILYLLLCLASCAQAPGEPGDGAEPDILSWVDPFIGTGGHGNTYPGATTPFGMIQLSPSTDAKGWDWYGGYHYSDTVLKGFAHTHTSGTGLAGLGDILLMPMAGEGTVLAGTDADPDSGFRSRFSHEREDASPGHYKVHLDDYNIDAELTATPRTGFHRYTFKRAGAGHVVIDPTHVIGIGKHEYITLSDYLLDTELEILSDTEVRGFKHTNGSAGNRRVYFYARFSRPFQEGRIAVDDKFTVGRKEAGYNTKALLSFDMEAGEVMVVKVALSFVSYERARKNFEAEAAGRAFDDALEAARATWRAHLSKIVAKGGTERQRRILYTALYHALLGPVIINDVDGHYYVEGKVYRDTASQYSSFSTWDTFRAQHPLLALLAPERTRQIVRSLISRYTVAGVDITIWELCGFDNMIMTGYTPVSVIYDAIVKGIPGIDEEAAYAAMRSVSMNEEKGSVFAKGSIVKQIKEYGFVTAELVQSATHTMEYAYQDWCIAQMAERLGSDGKLGQPRPRPVQTALPGVLRPDALDSPLAVCGQHLRGLPGHQRTEPADGVPVVGGLPVRHVGDIQLEQDVYHPCAPAGQARDAWKFSGGARPGSILCHYCVSQSGTRSVQPGDRIWPCR